MLYTDSDIVTLADLLQIDNEVQAVANSAKPVMAPEGSGSICEQAWREGGQKLLSAQQLYSTYLAQPGMTGGHMAAVLNVGVPARTQGRVRLNQIVAHESNYAGAKSPLQIWLAYQALYLFFRDASARLGKDRLEEKMTRYREETLIHWRGLRATGLPMIYQPLEAPGAKHSFSAGSWTAANATAIAGGTSTEQQVLIAITWYDASRYVSQANNGNAESAPSQLIGFTIPAANVLQVSIASLNPPAGSADPVGTSQGTWSPLKATHWNLWVGDAKTSDNPTLYLQKEGIPIATKTWTMGAPVFSGSVMQQGQWPDANLVFQNVVPRA